MNRVVLNETTRTATPYAIGPATTMWENSAVRKLMLERTSVLLRRGKEYLPLLNHLYAIMVWKEDLVGNYMYIDDDNITL